MVLGDKTVADRALKLANARMRGEVFPLLGLTINPRMWSPLRESRDAASPYGMKLWVQDKGALMILRNDQLMDMTLGIVIQETADAATNWEPKAFVTNILDSLMSDDG